MTSGHLCVRPTRLSKGFPDTIKIFRIHVNTYEAEGTKIDKCENVTRVQIPGQFFCMFYITNCRED
jgi:hypothetical protein